MQVLESAQAGAQPIVATELLQCDALVSDLLVDPIREVRVSLQQRGEGAGGAAAAAQWMQAQAGAALVIAYPGIPHQAPEPEGATIFVDLGASLEQSVQLPTVDTGELFDPAYGSVLAIEFEGAPAREEDPALSGRKRAAVELRPGGQVKCRGLTPAAHRAGSTMLCKVSA